MTLTHLADTSAVARRNRPTVAARLGALSEHGSLATCSAVELEVMISARSRGDFRRMRADRTVLFPKVRIGQAVLDRAEEVQALLADRGRHRQASPPDLIIAAAAESAGLTVLHYDADFEAIGEITGQPTEWVVARGSVS